MELTHILSTLRPSIEERAKLELKELPSHLWYTFLGNNSILPIIISLSLTGTEKEKLPSVTGS